MKKPPGIHAEPGCRDHFCVTRKLTSLFGADFDERAKLSITGVGLRRVIHARHDAASPNTQWSEGADPSVPGR